MSTLKYFWDDFKHPISSQFYEFRVERKVFESNLNFLFQSSSVMTIFWIFDHYREFRAKFHHFEPNFPFGAKSHYFDTYSSRKGWSGSSFLMTRNLGQSIHFWVNENYYGGGCRNFDLASWCLKRWEQTRMFSLRFASQIYFP